MKPSAVPLLAAILAVAPLSLAVDPPPAAPKSPDVKSEAAKPATAAAAKPADDSANFPPKPPITPLSPAESVKKVQLQPGYHLELVLSEPDIKEPAMITFDGNGRMFVAELNTYMQDIDGTTEHEPTSRVSLHWSSKGDGKFDKHTVFADKLLLPRMIMALDKGRVIIGETDTSDLNLYTDSDGDGVADKKEPWFVGGPRGGNLEHQPNGLLWGLDNWMYSTYNSYRLRWTPAGEPLKEPTAPNGGQWGFGQDEWGKTWFVNAGGEKGPVNFQTGIVYGAFNVKDQFAPDFDKVWPLVGLADVQGGPMRARPEDKTLNHFTATCGGEIFRGDRLPAELRGDLFFGEPVGRLVRRAHVEVTDGITRLSNPYGQSEFIRSTDPLFRPVNFITAPDGTLYITDMYRGIIQEGNWVKEGSYLRKVVQQYQLDKPVSMGRVWRLVHDSAKPGPQPKMFADSPTRLVAYLEHPNGWWRETAQKLLVLKQDKAVVPALTAMAQTNKNPLARVHALWTLEGLDALTPVIVRAALKDEHPQVRATGIRVSESLYKKDDKTLVPEVLAAAKDKDPIVAMQALLTAKLLDFPDWKKPMEEIVLNTTSMGVKEIGNQVLHPPKQIATKDFTPDQLKLFKSGENTFQTLCSACHGMDGKGMPMAGAKPGAMLAPSFAESKTVMGWREGPIHVLLQGLTGDIDGKKYEGQMVSMATNDDAWIAGVLSYVRKTFGNGASFVLPEDVARIRAATKDRTQPWTAEELKSTLPQPLANRKEWKLTASDKPADCGLAVDGKAETRYSTGRGQTPGQWFQIGLPQETEIVGLELDSAKSANDYPRGYKVELSTDGQTWDKPIATGKGNGAITDITFPAIKTKFIRITQTGTVAGNFWSIHELNIFAAKGASKVAQNHAP